MRRLAAADRQREILRAATAVFARSGYRGAGVADIAREAGVSEPLLYRHFSSKQAIFCTVLARIGQRILDIWEDAIVGAPDALTALRRAGMVYLANLRSHASEARLQFRALAEADDPAVRAVLAANHRAYLAFFEGLLDRGRAEGVLRAGVDPQSVAWLLNATGFTFTLGQLLDLGDPDGSRERALVDGLLEWIAEPGRAPHAKGAP